MKVAEPATHIAIDSENVASNSIENSAESRNSVVNGVVVKGGWDELPHNMGSLTSHANDANQGGKAGAKAPAKKRAPAKPRAKKNAPAKGVEEANAQDEVDEGANEAGGRAADVPAKPAPKNRVSRKKPVVKDLGHSDDVEMEDVMQDADAEAEAKPALKKGAPRKKATPNTPPAEEENAVKDETATGGVADGLRAENGTVSVDKYIPMQRASAKKAAPVKTEEDAASPREDGNDADVDAAINIAPITPTMTLRKRAPPKKKFTQTEVKKEDGAADAGDDAATITAPKTPKSGAVHKKAVQQPSPADSNAGGAEAAVKDEIPKSTITRKRAKKEAGERAEFEEQKPKRKRASRAKKVDTGVDVVDAVNKIIDGEVDTKVKKPKAATYGLTPGVTPYPDWPLPTAEACYEVNKLLSDLHGVVEQPETIPPPSLEITGCGEVPSVLDALIRTRLSAATSRTNSGYAFAGLVEKFGIMDSGIGKGSINWNKVREADEKVIEQAIKRGGLAKTKSESIKKILNMVHEQNLARREAFKKEKEEGIAATVLGAESLPQDVKDLEIAAADEDVLTLQYMHGLKSEEAMDELIKLPGIGVKTAACVTMFCLRRPCFAVDTHVYRLCKWLKWIPENASRDKAFSHCEVRIPDELKYSLHQLFIRHGQTCGRCRAITGQSSEGWENANCPIEHLVTRTGLRKTFKPLPKAKISGKKKGIKAKKEEDGEETESDLSEHDDEEFEDLLSAERDELSQSNELNDVEKNSSEAETEILDQNMEDAVELTKKEQEALVGA